MTKYHLNGVLETTKLVLESTVTQLLDLWARSQKGVLVRFGAPMPNVAEPKYGGVGKRPHT